MSALVRSGCAVLLVLIAGCTEPDLAGSPDSTADAEADALADAVGHDGLADRVGSDGRGEPSAEETLDGVGGALTQVVQVVEVIDERWCDFDGDGLGDNAVADLGRSLSSVFVMSMSALIAGRVAAGARFVLHAPWLDDIASPTDEDALLILFEAEDLDNPDDPSDDFDGDEHFAVKETAIDSCGEPLTPIYGVGVDRGEVLFTGESVPFPMVTPPTEMAGGEIEGAVEPGGAAAFMKMCGYARVEDLGRTEGLEGDPESSLLEDFLAGGARFGVPAVPGLGLNVDMDGDGLEQLLLGPDGHVESCIDGDSTVIPGSDCWLDPRITDAVGLVWTLSTVSAIFGGLEPGWEAAFEDAPCESPPEDSLWNPR